MMRCFATVLLTGLLTACVTQPSQQLRGTGDLGVVIERAAEIGRASCRERV